MSLLSRLAVEASRAYGFLTGSTTNVSADYLVVAGGGGGGSDAGGGGGAGGMLTSTATLSTLNTYSITVGAGGAGATYPATRAGNNGSNSVISGTGLSTVTSTGGGGGGSRSSYAAGNGGSGGGQANSGGSAGTGISGQGNNGASTPGGTTGGGGGGAGAAGSTKNGGNGLSSSITGSSVIYAGGGGAGGSSSPGTGGTGGGANGVSGGTLGNDGTTNLGGGAGGSYTNTAGNGGSGIVIISYTSATPKFVGGTITTSGGKQIHTFTSSGTLSPITPITASYLVVAGGGAGGGLKNGFIVGGGGGGAGGLLTSSTTLYSGATYVVTVGAGGAGVSAGTGGSGSSSSLSGTGLTTVTSVGGGGGGWNDSASGVSGGSGGGGSNNGSGGAGTSGQGNNGGGSSSNGGAGGGGGASAAGSSGSTVNGGNGGAGTASSITGTSTTYAGGGGGGGDPSQGGTSGTGGAGGGGNAGATANSLGGSGTANLGGGGGGCGGSSTATAKAGGNGGSGIVIISYAGSQQFNGGLVTSSGGNTIHTFTSTGALTPLTNNLNNSLRFRRSASAYLNRTPASATNRKTWTYSAWIKRGQIGAAQVLFSAGGGASPYTAIYFQAADDLVVEYYSAPTNYYIITSQVFRDPSAWYHIVVVWDTTQATSSNRIKIYVNGNQVTSFSTAIYPAQNTDGFINNNTNTAIGSWATVANTFDGYYSEVNFIDGQALEPYYFGNNDANQVWKPIQYKGTYGVNGFYLTFADTSALTTSSNAGLGKDTSGNGNYWATNNISITSGSTYDAMLDVPTNTSATVANYCVLNPLGKRRTVTQVATFSEANLKATFPNAAGNSTFAIGTFGVTSGKWYWEIPVVTRATEIVIGIGNTGTLDETNGGAGYQATNGAISGFTTNPPAGASYTSGDIIGVALDVDAGTCAFYKNNSLQGTGTGLLSTPQPWVQGNTNDVINANFGQRPFSYTPPTGYVALNTYNLPTPTILQGNKYMDATLYTGTGTTNVAVNQGQFKPDFLWVKDRSRLANHILVDSVRGVNNLLRSESTAAEVAGSFISSLNSNGFTLSANTISDSYYTNVSGDTFVGWQWQAGQGSTSSNTSGSITSTVSVNTTAGFSIVTYTGTGANATVGHGLGVAPAMVIVKRRNSTGNWNVRHVSITAANSLYLNLTNASQSDPTVWNSTVPTSTVFSIGTDTGVNASGGTYVGYCWAEIAGFSKFGSYTGNGSADGPFVYTGFRPKFIMIKSSSTGGVGYNWTLYDTSRNTYNVADLQLNANLSDAEAVSNQMDILSNGFKIFGSGTRHNGSGTTYIYAAFAENPFKNANAR